MVKVKRYRWYIFIILGFGYIVVYFHRLCPAVLALDMMRDLKAGGTLTGLLGSAYFYPYAIMQLPAGLLSDSWGARKSISIFLIAAFIGSILLGAASSTFWAVLGRTMVGFGVSMLFVPTMKVLSEWFDTGEFATMSGLLIAIGGLGSLISAAPLAWLSSWIGWRMSFVVIGIITGLISLLVWLIVRDRPEDLGLSPVSVPLHSDSDSIGLWEGVKKVLSYPWFWPVAVWLFFNATIFFAFGGLWAGPYLMHVYKLSKAGAGNILSMLSIGMIIGSPSLSYLSDQIFKARKPVLVISGFITILITLIMVLYTAKITIILLYVFFFLLGVFSSSVVSVGFTMTKELFPVKIAGTSIGLINLFPFLGGALFQPYIGYVLEQAGRVEGSFTITGYHKAITIFFICAVISFAASLFTKETFILVKKP